MSSVPAGALRRRALRARSAALWLGLSLVLATILATAVVQGRQKTWFGLVALSMAVILATLGRRMRWRMLLLTALASSLLLAPSVPIPLGLTLSEALLFWIVLAEAFAAAFPDADRLQHDTVGLRYYVPFAAFALLGLVSTYFNNEVQSYWPTVCLLPLILLILTDRLAEDEKDAIRLVMAALGAIVIFAAIVWLATATGHSQVMPGTGAAYRFGEARYVSLGPLGFNVWAIRVGSLAAMGLPVALVLVLRSRGWRSRGVFILAFFVLVAVLAMTFARGAILGAAAGTVAALLVSRRVKAAHVAVGAAVLLTLMIVAGPSLLGSLPQAGIARVAALGGGAGSIDNFVYRAYVMKFTLGGIMSHPFGPGFGFLWRHYAIDESIVYSALLNGTGVLGFLAFVTIVVQLGRGYLSGLSRWARGGASDMAAIGFGVLLTALLAGVSDHSVFMEPVQAFVFWTIIAATVTACARRGRTPESPGASCAASDGGSPVDSGAPSPERRAA